MATINGERLFQPYRAGIVNGRGCFSARVRVMWAKVNAHPPAVLYCRGQLITGVPQGVIFTDGIEMAAQSHATRGDRGPERTA